MDSKQVEVEMKVAGAVKEWFTPLLTVVGRIVSNKEAIEKVLFGSGSKLSSEETKVAARAGMACLQALTDKSARLRTAYRAYMVLARRARGNNDDQANEMFQDLANQENEKADLLDLIKVCLEKETKNFNTSVTAGIEAAKIASAKIAGGKVVQPGEIVWDLNCGTGPIKYQFYIMTSEGVLNKLYEYKPSNGLSMSDLIGIGSYVPKKPKTAKESWKVVTVAEMRAGINQDFKQIQQMAKEGGAPESLKNLSLLTEPSVVITGTIRESWENAPPAEKKLMEKAIANITLLGHSILGVKCQPWDTANNNYFITQGAEGNMEIKAVGVLVEALGAESGEKCKAVVSIGIGKGSSQFTIIIVNKDGTQEELVIGFPHGMNFYDNLRGDRGIDPIVTGFAGHVMHRLEEDDDKMLNQFLEGIRVLRDQGIVPVIGLKSGCLLLIDDEAKRHLVNYQIPEKKK